jgi:hypothetical protein
MLTKGNNKKDKKTRRLEREAKKKAPKLYTEGERQQKITNIMLEMAMLDFQKYLTDEQNSEMRALFTIYIKSGRDVEKDIRLPNIGRIIVMRLYNDKGKKSFINLKSTEEKVDDEKGANEFNKTINDLKEKGTDLTKNPQQI